MERATKKWNVRLAKKPLTGAHISIRICEREVARLERRYTINIDHVQSIRGGSSAIPASNSPGGVINFISKTGKEGAR